MNRLTPRQLVLRSVLTTIMIGSLIVITPNSLAALQDTAVDPVGVCGDPATGIHHIQGSGLTSPDIDSIREIEGIVVGDFQGAAGLDGIFVQEEDTDDDGDAATSEGIFIDLDGASSPAAEGQTVRVRGTVAEAFDLTVLNNLVSTTVCEDVHGAATPATVTLPVTSIDDLESFEGMSVNFPQTLFASGNFTQARFGEVDLSIDGPQDNPTNVVAPGAAANDLQDLNNRSRIQLDDGSTAQNPLPLPPYLGSDNTLRTGDSVTGITGALGYSFGRYELHPTTDVNFTRLNDRSGPPDVGGTIQVAAYNVLNYFTTLDDSGPICGPAADQGCRGADTADELTRQRDKIVDAITTLDAEVVGLMEIENHPGDVPTADLVAALNAATAPGTYDYITTGAIGVDVIRVAVIFQPAAVSPIGSFEILDASDDPTFNDDENRPMLIQTFEEVATGGKFTVAVNHLKSKGSDCDALGDPDLGDGQGNCPGTRTAAAQAIVDFLATDPTGSTDADFLIIGDLNAYAMEDPITTIEAGGYTDLIESYVGSGFADGAYSFNFFSQSGYLDHALASANIVSQVTGAAFWHVNADEPSGLDYNNFNQPGLYVADEFRSSDHDPVVVGLELDPDPIDETVALQLLAFNDYHGHVEATTAGSVDGVVAGGGEYLSAKLSELRQGVENTLTVAAGDMIGGSPAFSGLFHDEPSVETLNVMGLDLSGVGNHEFDEGVAELLRMQHGGCHPVDDCYFPAEPYAGADFTWLAANTIEQATGEPPLPAYSIEDVDGVDVAFIGMTLEATPTLVAASGIVGFDFLDEVETANDLVPVLQAQGVEAIVVLLHEGGSQNPPPGVVDACVNISGPILAIHDALDPAIDVLITGHTHLPYNCVLPDAAGEPRIVTSAYSFGRVVSELNLVLDRTTGDVRRDLSSATNHVVDQSALTADPAITAVLTKWQPLFDESGTTPIGTITADINRGGIEGSDRGVESAAGNLVADAQAWATSFNGAELALMNPGGVRSDLTFAESADEGDGVVTFGEAFTFQPFGNTLVTVPMTGAQIVSVLEEQCQPAGSGRPFLHLGVSDGFTYDLATTINGDCTAISVTNVRLFGDPLDPAATYSVTVNNFLADGGDNFTTFATLDPALRLDGGNDLEALTNYLNTFGPVDPPSTDRVNEIADPGPTPTPTPTPMATPTPTPTATPAPTPTPTPTPEPLPECRGHVATIIGSGIVLGTPGNDVIVTGNGADLILGGGGDDIICSGRGRDLVIGGHGNDEIFSQAGRDVVLGGPGNDHIRGGGGADYLDGGRGYDVCRGGGGLDWAIRCEVQRGIP